MILVKIKDGMIEHFPYTIDDLRSDYPDVSFPMTLTSEILKDFSVYQVFYQPFPVYDKRTQTLNVAQTPVLINGVWTMTRTVTNKTVEEIVAYDTEELKSLRTQIFDEIDAKTNSLITYGFVYNGQNVRLTREDQRNFEGAFRMILDLLADNTPASALFPTQFKVWTNSDTGVPIFMSFDDIIQVRNWIIAGKAHIQACLMEGWRLKEVLSTATFAELSIWTDVR